MHVSCGARNYGYREKGESPSNSPLVHKPCHHHHWPNFWGKMYSSSSWASIQSIKYSTYFGAETSIGFFTVIPSAHLYSYLVKKRRIQRKIQIESRSPSCACTYFGPADIVGHVNDVQNSVSVPYRMFTWLKKSTAAKCNEYVHRINHKNLNYTCL